MSAVQRKQELHSAQEDEPNPKRQKVDSVASTITAVVVVPPLPQKDSPKALQKPITTTASATTATTTAAAIVVPRLPQQNSPKALQKPVTTTATATAVTTTAATSSTFTPSSPKEITRTAEFTDEEIRKMIAFFSDDYAPATATSSSQTNTTATTSSSSTAALSEEERKKFYDDMATPTNSPAPIGTNPLFTTLSSPGPDNLSLPPSAPAFTSQQEGQFDLNEGILHISPRALPPSTAALQPKSPTPQQQPLTTIDEFATKNALPDQYLDIEQYKGMTAAASSSSSSSNSQ